MKIRSFLTCTCVAFAAMTMHAEGDTSHYLHIQTDGGWTVLNLDTVDRLSFEGADMVATDSQRNVLGTFSRSKLASMYVDDDPEMTGIQAVTDAGEAAPAFAFDPAARTVTMLSDGDFAAYSLDGSRLVYIDTVKASETIDLSAMTENVVILKSGNYTLKTVSK